MTTTRNDIRSWLERAKAKGATHMLVVCDTFSYEDYPVFVMPDEKVHVIADKNNGPNMTRLMEVYNMSKNLDEQLASKRCFNY